MSTSIESPPRVWMSKALLLVPFFALIIVPIYNRVTPTMFGVPFFYWYSSCGLRSPLSRSASSTWSRNRGERD
jgi:hypothetical protein